MGIQSLDARSRIEGPLTPAARWRLGGWAALVVWLAVSTILHGATLLRYPSPFLDEANLGSSAWGVLHTGWAFGPLQAGVLSKLEGHWTYFPLLGSWLQSIPVHVVGFGLLPLRLTSLLFGVGLLVALYVIATSLYDRATGLTAVVVTTLSSAFLYSSHIGRHDIIVAALGYAAVALYLTDRSTRLSRRSVLSGLAVGLAFEIHPNAALFGPAVILLYLLDHGLATIRLPRFWGFVGGVAVGLMAWAALHVAQYPATFSAITSLAFASSKTPPLLSADPGIVAQSLLDTLLLAVWPLKLDVPAVFVFPGTYRAVLLVWALASLTIRRSRSDTKALVLFGSLFVCLVALIQWKPPFYAVLLSPAGDLAIAALLRPAMGSRIRQAILPRVCRMGCVALLEFGVLLYWLFPVITQDAIADYRATASGIQSVVEPGSVLMGDHTFWLEWPHQRFVAFYELTYFPRYAPGSSLEDTFREYRPDYFVSSPFLEQFVTDDTSDFVPWAKILAISKRDLDDFLERRAQLAGEVETSTYGKVKVYRIDWAD